MMHHYLFVCLMFALIIENNSLLSKSIQCNSLQEKIIQKEALSFIAENMIKISSYGNCNNRTSSYCTSLEQINCISLCGIAKYRQLSKCNVTITGGTENGHQIEENSHMNGFRLNIGLNTCNENYIKKSFQYIGESISGASQWQDTYMNVYRLEGNHWNILYVKC